MARYQVSNGAISGTEATTQYLKETKRTEIMSRETERQLIVEAQAGSISARNAVITANLRFAMQVARQYQGNGLAIEDLIGFANVGLFEAVARFDLSKNVKFTTFAVWYIRAELQKALNDLSRVVRIPSHRTSTEEYSVKSIHAPVGEDENKETWADRHLESTNSLTEFEQEDRRIEIVQALNRLTDKQREAICRSVGFGYEYAQSMEQIGEALGISSERARQLVRSAELALRKKV